MKTYILPLSDPQARLETVGGKGLSLAKLANAGLPVPDGFHITTEAYRQFVATNDLQPGINHALEIVDSMRPSTLETASENIGRLFAEAPIPVDLADAIAGAYEALPDPNPPVAVRSSATAEDLPEASFAGQQETYLNISGTDQVLAAVKKCWASLWTGRAIGYRLRQRIGDKDVALAVVVQLLVDAEASGILFTANPINGDRDEAVINATWGLGEAIVGGAVTPDILTVSKQTGRLIRRETAEKLVMTARTETGTKQRPVPEPRKRAPVLSDEQAAQLARYGWQIEELYGMAMDIEWAWTPPPTPPLKGEGGRTSPPSPLLKGEGGFAIVQARPITALPEAPIKWALPDPKGTYMRASVADLMPEPLSPLFETLGLPALASQMQPLGKLITGSEPVLPKDYLTTINNYVYMNAYFPPRSWWWILTGLIPAYPKMLRKLVLQWREKLLPDYRVFVESKADLIATKLTADDLWCEVQALMDAAAYYICGLMFATMGASAGSEGLLTRTYDKLAKKDGDPEATVLLMGWDNIPVRSEKSLYDMARWIAEDETLSEYILTTSSRDLAVQLKKSGCAPVPLFPEFASRFLIHMANFGHVVFQLDFAELLPLDHPEMSLETIKMYLRGEGVNPHERQKVSEEKRIQTTETMLKRLKGFKLWAFRIALNWGQSMAAAREDALAEIGLAYPKMRELLRDLGRRFVVAGALHKEDDIFWLEKEEISNCIAKLDRNQELADLRQLVENRRAFNEKIKQISPPPMIPMKKRVMGIKIDTFIAATEEAQAGNVLKGVPTSAGKVTAPARVLRSSEDFDEMRPGDVLVAGTTTPAWTPLFAMACAVVTDIGGPLSHGSIVAREYGIPAVMGTGIATKRIRSGQMVTVDGNAGTVILEAPKG